MTDTEKTNEAPNGPSDSKAMLDVVMCKCGKNQATEPHGCPYAEEIGGSTDSEYCTCCNDCRRECCMDI